MYVIMLIRYCICDFLSVVVLSLCIQDFMGWFPLRKKFILYSEPASISLPTVTGCAIFVVNLCKGKEAEQLLNIGLIWDYMSHNFAGKPLVVSSCSLLFETKAKTSASLFFCHTVCPVLVLWKENLYYYWLNWSHKTTHQ